jgi:hypothetical protein
MYDTMQNGTRKTLHWGSVPCVLRYLKSSNGFCQIQDDNHCQIILEILCWKSTSHINLHALSFSSRIQIQMWDHLCTDNCHFDMLLRWFTMPTFILL